MSVNFSQHDAALAVEPAISVRHATVPVDELRASDRAAMLRLMQACYLGVTPDQFERDLAEKERVIVLRDLAAGQIVGFSTLMSLELSVEGQTARAIFSGDTIVARDRRRTLGLGRELARYFCAALEEAQGTPIWYILISKGWQTCRIPRLFFIEYSPSPGRPFFPRHHQVMDAFGALKYPGHYQPETGLIIAAEGSQRLRPASPEAEIPPRPDSSIQLFLEKNPDYLRGDELIYVAEVAPWNFAPGIKRLSEERRDGLVN